MLLQNYISIRKYKEGHSSHQAEVKMEKSNQKSLSLSFIINRVITGIALVGITAFTHKIYLSISPRLSNPPFDAVTHLLIDSTSHTPEIEEYCDLAAHDNSIDEYLIDTQGCKIRKFASLLHTGDYTIRHCDGRAVSVEKISEDQIQFLIHNKHSTFKLDECIYQFAILSDRGGDQDNEIKFSNNKPFINGTIANLEHEIINISCQYFKDGKATPITYEDFYMIVKKNKENRIQNLTGVNKWNVLLLGVDTMSRARVYHTMPKTTCFLIQHGWLDYNAYHKIASKTHPNIITLLTGRTSVFDDETRKRLIWNTFQTHGYVTAYGEDEVPYIFQDFESQPTDHYMRPLFFLGNIGPQGPSCTGARFSCEQILNYAFDFAHTYHKSNPFFGFFWTSFAHNVDVNPSQIDKLLKTFFNKLNDSGILESTFIVFLGDHGIRFGPPRFSVQGYYETRLPMLFMWVPEKFRELYPEQYSNAVTNQQRLVTPYDHHATLLDILKLSLRSDEVSSPICHPYCLSIFNDHPATRTCADANISDKWCGCHILKLEQFDEPATNKSIYVMAEFVKRHIISIPTIKCTKCEPVELKSVLRVHSYETNQKKFFVVAINVTVTGNVYEGLVVQNGDNFEVIGGAEVISRLTVSDNCVLDWNLKGECVCLMDKSC